MFGTRIPNALQRRVRSNKLLKINKMPNHITNRVIVEGPEAEVQKFFDFIKAPKPNKDGTINPIDFNKIIPMPDALNIESSSLGEDGMQYLVCMSGNVVQRHAYEQSEHYRRMLKQRAERPEMFEKSLKQGGQYLRNIADFGHKDWYSWRCANWGTKWNAYEQILEGNQLCFQTAWSGVPNLIAILAEKFPTLTIEYKYADENTSYNTGSFIMHGEDIKDLSPEDASAEAWEIVFELGVCDPEDFIRLEDGTYKWKEDDGTDS